MEKIKWDKEMLRQCVRENKLPSELKGETSQSGNPIDKVMQFLRGNGSKEAK